MTDFELLQQYRAGSQAAFTELAARHVNWVYSAALRRVRDPHLAQDVTQATFLALAQGAKIREGAPMSAWLFQVLRFTSAKVVRGEFRRKRHEAAAVALRPETSSDTQWQDVAPLLEDAVAKLGHRDRTAVLMRFYEQRSLSEIAGALKLSEEGARKRISRAIDKLRAIFAAQGFTAGAAPLTAMLSTHAATPAPAGLSITPISSSAATADLAKNAIQMIKRTNAIRLAVMIMGAAATISAIAIGLVVINGRTRADAAANPSTQIAATSPDPATRPTTLTIDQVIAGVRTAETSFTNVYIKDFRTTIDLKPAGQPDWKPTPMIYSGSAWYDGDPEGKIRIYFAQRVLPWERSPGNWSWSGEEVDDSWDGKEGREVRVAAGFPRATFRDNSAMLDATRPMMLSIWSRYQTGVGYTMQYHVADSELDNQPHPRQTIWELIDKSAKHNEPPEMCEQTMNGFETVRVRWVGPDNLASRTYWFSPAHSFALVKSQYILNIPKQERAEGFDVTELKEVAPGIFFPTRAADVEQEGGKPGTYRRYNYTAADVRVNDPKFDPSIFSTPIPVGYIVGDNRAKRRDYMILKDGTQQELKIGDTLPVVKPLKPKRPDAKEPTSLP